MPKLLVPSEKDVNPQTLDALLRARGWTRSELARAIGVSRQAVSLWFKGERSRVGVRGDHLLGIAEALGVPAETLAQPLPALGASGDRARAALLVSLAALKQSLDHQSQAHEVESLVRAGRRQHAVPGFSGTHLQNPV